MPKAGSKLRRAWSEKARLAAPPCDGPCVTHRGRLDIATRSKCAASGFVQAQTALSCTRALSLPLPPMHIHMHSDKHMNIKIEHQAHQATSRRSEDKPCLDAAPAAVVAAFTVRAYLFVCTWERVWGWGGGEGRGHEIYRQQTHTHTHARLDS